MAENFNARIKNKRDTSANWTTNDPVILNGEIILVDTATGELRAKIGDGTKRYTELPFTDEAIKTLLNNKADADHTHSDEAIDAQYMPLSVMMEDGSFNSYLPTEMGSIKKYKIINSVENAPIAAELIAVNNSGTETYAQIIRMYKPSTYNPDTEPNYAYKEWQRVISDVTGERVYGAWNQTFPIEIPETIEVDTELSTTSENPVQNKIITNALNNHIANKNEPHVQRVSVGAMTTLSDIIDGTYTGFDGDEFITSDDIKKFYLTNVGGTHDGVELIVAGSYIDGGCIQVLNVYVSGNVEVSPQICKQYYRTKQMGSWSDWKLVEHLDEELDTASTNAVQNKVVATKINDVETALDGKAPTSHASSSTMYGVGTSTEYGHLKVADNLTTTTSGTALSANQGKVLNDSITKIENNTTLIKNSNGGFAAGTGAVTNHGGAIGENANSTNGGAIGYKAIALSDGGAVGRFAETRSGGAVGDNAESSSGFAGGMNSIAVGGGAVGYNARTSEGFAGGSNAICATEDYSTNIDAIQLGRGTNSTEKTLQVYDYQLMDASGNIPAERLANVPQIIVEDNLTSTSSANALSANQGKILYNAISTETSSRQAADTTLQENIDAIPIKSLAGQTVQPESGTTVTARTGATIIGDLRTRTFSSSFGVNSGNIASGDYAVAIGQNATANGKWSTALGYTSTASGMGSLANGSTAVASGNYSTALGCYPKATGDYSLAVGQYVESTGSRSLAFGGYNGSVSNVTKATNTGSIALGINAKARGMYAINIGGYDCDAAGMHSIVGGYGNTTKMLQTIFGQYANNKTAGAIGATTGDAFIIGNGTSEATSNAFRVSYAGSVYGIGSFKTTGADYAEYFEWLDGNPDNEDRRGRFVTLDGDKIRFATADDDYILGVVSAAPAVEGDNYDDDWQGKYLTDVFGTRLTQTVHYEAEYEEHEIIDPETGEKTVEKVLLHEAYDAEEWILNPDYDPTQEYVSREDRKEWSPIGFMGKLVVIDDGTCKVNGYCKAGENGIATKTTDKSGYRVMERIDDTHIKILVR